ncbi:MAG: chorismate mutase [Pelagibacterales bacterium]|nr:chorismate mutase [Pelagibacterales bacterium]
MENQHNKSDDALLILRQEIDKIDNQIIKLLSQRMEVVKQVGELKKNNNEKFFIRANREADMIKDLIKKTDSSFPKSVIVNIWRKIIASANMTEQSLNIVIHNPKNIADYPYLVKDYYNQEIPISLNDSVTKIVQEIESNQVQIAAFALPKGEVDNNDKLDISENWWINLANNKLGIRVFAKIPFIEIADKKLEISCDVNLVLVASKEPEKSSQDNSLLYLEVAKDFSKSEVLLALSNGGFESKILKSVRLPQIDNVVFYLVEVRGFYVSESQEIKELSKSKPRPFVKVLGNYATPILI